MVIIQIIYTSFELFCLGEFNKNMTCLNLQLRYALRQLIWLVSYISIISITENTNVMKKWYFL